MKYYHFVTRIPMTEGQIIELVRVTHFPDKPSRFKCLYVCKSLEEAKKWKENFESYK